MEPWQQTILRRELLLRGPSIRLSRLWLTRQAIGDYMLTALEPRIVKVRGAGVLDAYLREGEPIGVRHLCPLGTAAIFHLPPEGLETLRPARVEVYGRMV